MLIILISWVSDIKRIKTVLTTLKLCIHLKRLSQPLSLAKLVIGMIAYPIKAKVDTDNEIYRSITSNHKYDIKLEINEIRKIKR